MVNVKHTGALSPKFPPLVDSDGIRGGREAVD